jgi:nicotinamide N-methyltransferase
MPRDHGDDDDAASDSSGPEFDTALFEEPQGFFPPPADGKVVTYDRRVPAERHAVAHGDVARLPLRLAPKHSLWAHELWNASSYLAWLMDEGQLDVRGQACLELGAGAGLLSLIAALNGARVAVATDYSRERDVTLLGPLSANAAWLNQLRETASQPWSCTVAVLPHVWGTDTCDVTAAAGASGRFSVIFCADLLFNRSCHSDLLASLESCLAEQGVAHVAFSHHDPQKRDLDLAFFTKAQQCGFDVTHVCDHRFERDLFVENDGLDDQRAVVHYYTLTRSSGDARSITGSAGGLL